QVAGFDDLTRVQETWQGKLGRRFTQQRRDNRSLVGRVRDSDGQHDNQQGECAQWDDESVHRACSPVAPVTAGASAAAFAIRYRRSDRAMPPPSAMMKAASQTKFTSGRTWMRTLHLPAPRSSPSATRMLLP